MACKQPRRALEGCQRDYRPGCKSGERVATSLGLVAADNVSCPIACRAIGDTLNLGRARAKMPLHRVPEIGVIVALVVGAQRENPGREVGGVRVVGNSTSLFLSLVEQIEEYPIAGAAGRSSQ